MQQWKAATGIVRKQIIKFQLQSGAKNAAMNQGLITVILIDCMVAIPWDVGCLARACMTKVEKAKKIPPLTALPTVANKINGRRKFSTIVIMCSF